MNQTGITYFVDSKFKFSKSKYFPFLQWLDINNCIKILYYRACHELVWYTDPSLY